MKKILLVLIVTVLAFSVTSCVANALDGAERNIKIGDMSITLTDSYKDKSSEVQGVTAAFESKDVAVFVQKETFKALNEAYKDGIETEREYIDAVIVNLKDKSDSDITISDDDSGFIYTVSGEDDDYINRVAVYKSDSAFWMVQFICRSDDYEGLKTAIEGWEKSVAFSEKES